MLVVKEQRKLLLNLSNPDRVVPYVPGAKMVNIKGNQIVSVPHEHDVTKFLRNIGIGAPGPILSYYDWPCLFPNGPFIHQRETGEFCSLHPRAYVLNDMGTGKTVSVLWAFDWLRRIGKVDWLLVVSPLSTLERTWADEVYQHLPHLSCGVVYGDAERRLKIANREHQVYVINHDGLKNKKLLEFFCKKPGRGMVVVDELAVFRNANTDRWKAVNTLVNGNSKLGLPPKEWAWGLTGTPIPNEPTDAWAQCKLIRPGTVPKFFGAFRDTVMNKYGPYKWVRKPGALDTVHRLMQPAIRFSREQCVDLPPTTIVDRHCEFSATQQRMYNEMLRTLKATHAEGHLTAANEAVAQAKLVQIACGVGYSNGATVAVEAQNRIDLVNEIIEQAGGNVIVFVPYTAVIEYVAKKIEESWPTDVIHGGVSKAERDSIFHRFQNSTLSKVLVAQPGTMAHGLTLTAADTIIWYAPITSAEIYQQANARIVRPGQKRNTLIVNIEGCETERKMYTRLKNRESTQGTLLEMFE